MKPREQCQRHGEDDARHRDAQRLLGQDRQAPDAERHRHARSPRAAGRPSARTHPATPSAAAICWPESRASSPPARSVCGDSQSDMPATRNADRPKPPKPRTIPANIATSDGVDDDRNGEPGRNDRDHRECRSLPPAGPRTRLTTSFRDRSHASCGRSPRRNRLATVRCDSRAQRRLASKLEQLQPLHLARRRPWAGRRRSEGPWASCSARARADNARATLPREHSAPGLSTTQARISCP